MAHDAMTAKTPKLNDAPFYSDDFIDLYQGDVLDVLRQLPSESVHCVVTSPPYFGLRDYGTAEWEGGAEDCDHRARELRRGVNLAESVHSTRGGAKKIAEAGWIPYRSECGKCGAVRKDQQIGLEDSPADFIARVVEVFTEIRRVLRSDGVCFLNLGDSYAGSGRGLNSDGTHSAEGTDAKQSTNQGSLKVGSNLPAGLHENIRQGGAIGRAWVRPPDGFKPKDLMGMPWRVAFALQEAGWWLRQDIIWSKPNPMPESVTDRCTKAHEYIFLLTKSAKYFYDAEAIKEESAPPTGGRQRAALKGSTEYVGADFKDYHEGRTGRHQEYQPSTRNKRSVWAIAPMPFPEAHFATFPPELPELCIKAGTSEHGCCAECGKPYVRMVEKACLDERRSWNGSRFDIGKTLEHQDGRTQSKDSRDRSFDWSRNGKEDSGSTLDGEIPQTHTVGWQKACKCEADAVVPCTVLEPFSGSGTTLITAKKLGRRSVGIELNPEYAAMSVRRIERETSMPLFDEPNAVPEAPSGRLT